MIEIGTHCLELEGWKEKDEEGRKQKEIFRELAAAYEQTEEIANAAGVYEELLDMEESSEQREQIYEKLVLLYEKNNDHIISGASPAVHLVPVRRRGLVRQDCFGTYRGGQG